MSKTEEKLNKEVKEGIVPEDVAYAMRSHTNATLDELKEKVQEFYNDTYEKYEVENDPNKVLEHGITLDTLRNVQKLIDEVRNE